MDLYCLFPNGFSVAPESFIWKSIPSDLRCRLSHICNFHMCLGPVLDFIVYSAGLFVNPCNNTLFNKVTLKLSINV